MTMNATDTAVAEEIARLKDAFCYRSYRIDLDFLLDDLERIIFSAEHLAGRTIFTVASELVIDAYYENDSLEPLVKIYTSQPFRNRSRFDRLLTALEAADRPDLIEKFWEDIAGVTRNEYWFQRPARRYGEEASVAEFRGYLTDCYQFGIDHLTHLGRTDAARRLKEELDQVDRVEQVTTSPPSDLRKMNEEIFWEVIQKAAAGSSDPIEQTVCICEQLLNFRSADIKRFISIYAKQMKSLYHWNVWALAYAARGGCSDTAFELFRTWLILQGDKNLLVTARTKPHVAAAQVPADPKLPADNLLLDLIEVYVRREGNALEIPELDTDAPRGKRWSESLFHKVYPELAGHYKLTDAH